MRRAHRPLGLQSGVASKVVNDVSSEAVNTIMIMLSPLYRSRTLLVIKVLIAVLGNASPEDCALKHVGFHNHLWSGLGPAEP